MKKFVSGSLAGLALCGTVNALGVVPGFYAGLIGTVSYTPSVHTYEIDPCSLFLCFFPVISSYSTINYSVGGGAGLQLGYRYLNYRLEIEGIGNYNKIRKISFPGTGTVYNKSSSLTQTIAIGGDTLMGAGFFNAYFDFNREQEIGSFSPYAGVGIGYAYLSTSLTRYINDVKYGTLLSESSSHPAGQVILGISYALDSYTTIAADGRYIATANNNSGNNVNNRYEAGTFNILFNVAFDHVVTGSRGPECIP